jgi:hypothetical protein
MRVMTTTRSRKTTRPTSKSRPTPPRDPAPVLRPLNEIAAALKAAVARLPRCEYLQTYLTPLLNLVECEGYYGMDRVTGLVGYAHDAIDYQPGLSSSVARQYQQELATHLRAVGINL